MVYLGRALLRAGLLAADLDDEVDSLRVAVVVDAMELIGGAVDRASSGNGYGRRVGDELQRALAEEHHLGVRVAMRRMRRLAGVELGLVDFDVRNAGDQAVKNLVPCYPRLAGVAWRGGDGLTDGERGAVGGGWRLGYGLRSLGSGVQRMQKRQQGKALTKVTTREGAHADDGSAGSMELA